MILVRFLDPCIAHIVLCYWGAWKLTHCNRLDALALLDDTVEQLHLVQRRLLPAIFTMHGDDFLAQRLDNLWVLADINERKREQIASSVDGSQRQHNLRKRRVVRNTLLGVLEPLERIVELVGLFTNCESVGAQFPSALQHGGNDAARVADHGARFAAFAEEHVGYGPNGPVPAAQVLGCFERCDCVFLGDVQPFFVAAEFFAEEDAG